MRQRWILCAQRRVDAIGPTDTRPQPVLGKRVLALICETSLNWNLVNILDGLTKFCLNRVQSYLVYLSTPTQRANKSYDFICLSIYMCNVNAANTYVFSRDNPLQ